MAREDTSTLGTLILKLSENRNLETLQQYRIHYKPVLPASREIPGSPDSVAPETTIAQWSMNDWAQGEGDVVWRDRGRYNTSAGMGPASDGSGLVVGPQLIDTQLESAGGDFSSKQFARIGANLAAAYDATSTLFVWDTANEEWDASWAIGGSGSEKVHGMASTSETTMWCSLNDGTIRKVETGGNSEHVNAATWVTTVSSLVGFQGSLYGLKDNDLYKITLGSTDTITLVGDTFGGVWSTSWGENQIYTSDVGPIWVTHGSDGRSELWEYNVADDTAKAIAQLPPDTTAYTPFFYNGIYFVSYRAASLHTLAGDAYLYFQSGGQRGHIGPFRAPVSSVSQVVSIAGVIGDRIIIDYAKAVWAYDMSSGGISNLTDDLTATSISAKTYGDEVFASPTGAVVQRLDLAERDATQGTLDSGRFDFGYQGLSKALTAISVVCESALAASDAISVAVATDGGSFTTLSGPMGSGDVQKTWAVSTSSTMYKGKTFEIRVLVTAGAVTQNPKVISIDAEAESVTSRIEWSFAVDVTDNNEQDGTGILTGLKTLKTNQAVVSFTDSWTDDDGVAGTATDVTVQDVVLPAFNTGSDDYAMVTLRATQTV